jgi:L-malate glycosyltransferase
MDSALTILHLDPERGWRGGQRQTLWLAAGLARRGHRSVIAARPGEPLYERARAAGLAVVPAAPFGELDVLAALRLRRLIAREGVRIVHAHSGHSVALAALATLGTRACVVVTRRVDFPLKRNPGTRWKYGRAAGVVAISRAVAAVLRASGVPEPVRIIPDGVDLSRRVQPASAEALAALGVPPGAPLVVMVAALVDHKDPLNFVAAVDAARRRVPGLHALLVGDGRLRPAVEAEVVRRGLADALHVAGYRTDADALLAAATVATLSSKEEGMGSVLLDAMAFGVPVAATRAGGITDAVVDGVSGLLAPPRDGDALGEAIARVVLDPALAARLAAAGRERVREFSVEQMARRYEHAYRDILHRRG